MFGVRKAKIGWRRTLGITMLLLLIGAVSVLVALSILAFASSNLP